MDYKIPEPRLPTFNDVKQGLAGLYDAVRNPPDPSQTAGNIINAARQGDYASALEQGLTMPGVGVGMFVKPYDAARLAEAHNMRALRATPDEIWRKTQTGDLGNGMVQEIDDRVATINPSAAPNRMSLDQRYNMMRQANPGASGVYEAARVADQLDNTPHTAPISSVLRHPQVYEAEPGVANAPVRQGANPGFDYTSQQLVLDPRATPQQQRLSALEMVQRAISEHNGWSMGGTDTQMFKADQTLAKHMPESFFEAQANRLAGNQLAKATARRADMTPEQRAARFPERDMDMPINQQTHVRFK